jgi:hypothetical protein
MEVFKAFRGREPSADAILRHYGLAESQTFGREYLGTDTGRSCWYLESESDVALP